MMPRIERHTALQPASFSAYSDIIDVRSPAEFAEDRIPGAVNLPVLDNDERAQVGTMYVQQSRFRARRLGAALVSANISRHLQTFLAGKSADYRPLIYCWRGGMRSDAMATVLSAIGWRVSVLDNGYKAWRRQVVFALREDPVPLKVVLLDGQTGTAKTRILQTLAQCECQTLDLEGLAKHRGSVFGHHAGDPQPSQKFFESKLWWVLSEFDLQRHIIVEAESNLIGRRLIPDRLASAMQSAPRIEVWAELKERARYLVRAYGDVITDTRGLAASINALRPFHARATIEHWLTLAAQEEFEHLAADIAQQHYDPLYSKQRHSQPLVTIHTDVLEQAGIAATAKRIAAVVAGLEAGKSTI
ncbi:MAG: tRNA 2-selenouridine(34) synthase MnmH [Pseudomonadota bacterium]